MAETASTIGAVADAHLDRRVWAALPLVLVALVVVLVLVVGGGTDDADDDAAPSATPSPSATTTAPTSPDDFCVAFRAFAEASNNLVAFPDDPDAQDRLREAGRALLDLPTPLGLSDGGDNVITDAEKLKDTVRRHIADGASIIDVGGSRPRSRATTTRLTQATMSQKEPTHHEPTAKSSTKRSRVLVVGGGPAGSNGISNG